MCRNNKLLRDDNVACHEIFSSRRELSSFAFHQSTQVFDVTRRTFRERFVIKGVMHTHFLSAVGIVHGRSAKVQTKRHRN